MSDDPTLPALLVVESDDAVRSTLVQNLRRWGYRVIVSLDIKDASERVREGALKVDVILINQVGLSLDELIISGRAIRQQSAGSSTDAFIVLLAEEYGVDLEGQDVQVGDREYITYLEDGEQLMNLLHRLCPV
jgi:DNA-binding response OmpR family regulator